MEWDLRRQRSAEKTFFFGSDARDTASRTTGAESEVSVALSPGCVQSSKSWHVLENRLSFVPLVEAMNL